MTDINIAGRRRARRLVLQALYQWIMADAALTHIEIEFNEHTNMAKVDSAYFRSLLHEIPKSLSEIDGVFTPFLDRALDELNIIELIAIRIGCYELAMRPDIPYKVAINEAVALAKTYGTIAGYKYVNGILDKVASKVRVSETQAAH